MKTVDQVVSFSVIPLNIHNTIKGDELCDAMIVGALEGVLMAIPVLMGIPFAEEVIGAAFGTPDFNEWMKIKLRNTLLAPCRKLEHITLSSIPQSSDKANKRFEKMV